MNPEIVQYILEHRDTYTREAIRQHLIDAGHAPEEVDAAWEEVEAGRLPAPPASEAVGARPASVGQPDTVPVPPATRLVNSPAFWFTLIGFIIAVYALPFVLAAILPLPSGSRGITAGLTFGLLWLGGLVAALILARRNRPVAMGLALGFAGVFLLPFTLVMVVLGICLVARPFGT